MKRLKILNLSVAVAAILNFSGCGSSDSTSSTTEDTSTKITGTISGNGYAKNDILNNFLNNIITPAYAVGIDDPDSILVIFNKGRNNKLFPISADGSFEIDTELLTENDLVVFVVNQTSKKIFGHLNLNTNTTEKLDFIDKSALQDDLALGSIDTENNCSSDVNIHSTTSFSEDSLDTLEKISRQDDSLILYSNNWKNENIDSYISVSFQMPSVSSIDGQYNTISSDIKADLFTGVNPLFYLGEAVGTDITSIDLYPSSNIKHAGTNLQDTNMTYDANETNPILKTGLSFNSDAGVTTVETANVDSFPAGDWILKNHDTNETLGAFEFVGADPFDTNDKFKVIIPKAKITTDENGTLEKVDLQYWTQLPDGTLEQITSDDFDKIAHDTIFSYVLSSGDGTSSNFTQSSTSTQTEIVFTSNEDINTSDVSRIIYSYQIGQSKYQFFFE